MAKRHHNCHFCHQHKSRSIILKNHSGKPFTVCRKCFRERAGELEKKGQTSA